MNRRQSTSRQAWNRIGRSFIAIAFVAILPFATGLVAEAQDELTSEELAAIRAAEQARIGAIQTVYGSVVAVYGEDRGGGGSGVVIDPSGLALTNHHVIQGAGTTGWGGLADGKLYRWRLIGTDPGGDVAIIQLEGRDEFPYAILADSDTVRVGDFALAMGNPFILAEDQTPTVTLGIVSGVKRYQYGSGNELVYGNCIQTDSSINPGNSGGPLFNMMGEIIGINGRGSFEERGRVNVGLGYAISSNQIRNFVPDLLATKVVEHGTLDANFGDRSGGVVCETINLNSPVAKMGLELGDRLIAFEGQPITSANQFTNLICTLPEEWPAEITFEKQNGERKTVWVRLLGLPYTPPPAPQEQPMPEGEDQEEPTPEQQEAMERQQALLRLLRSPAGTILDQEINKENLDRIVGYWRSTLRTSESDGEQDSDGARVLQITDSVIENGQEVGTQTIWLTTDGRFRLLSEHHVQKREYIFDGEDLWLIDDDAPTAIRTTDASADPYVVQLLPIASAFNETPLSYFGDWQLDGGDKAQRKAAYRLKSLDANGNWFYVWLSMPPSYQLDDIDLQKASVDMDGDEGAVTFGEWDNVSGIRWPHLRSFAEGLSETPSLQFRTNQIELLESFDHSIFESVVATESED